MLKRQSRNTRVTPLIQELVDPVPPQKIPSLEWGKNNEHNAAAAFMKSEGVKHSQPKVLPCGFFILKSHPYIGATPEIREVDVWELWDKTNFF